MRKLFAWVLLAQSVALAAAAQDPQKTDPKIEKVSVGQLEHRLAAPLSKSDAELARALSALELQQRLSSLA